MRLTAYLRKTFLESLRDWKIMSVALLFAPAFVYMIYGYLAAAAPAYRLLVLDGDGGSAAHGLAEAWQAARHAGGEPMFVVTAVAARDEGRRHVARREADVMVEIPPGFSRSVEDFKARRTTAPARLLNHADDANVRGSMAMVLSDYVAFSFCGQIVATPSPLDVSVERVGNRARRNDFDVAVPALLVMALIMVFFTAGASLIKEVDRGTLVRLNLSRLRASELLAAVAANQVLIGAGALLLAYVAAVSCGFRASGSLAALFAVGAVTTVAVVAMAVMTAAFLRSMFALLTVGCFPFFILMFFSGCMFPLPQIRVGILWGHVVSANDVLPTALCVRAFDRILGQGARLADVGFELGAITFLTALYFAAGAALFRWRHQRVA